MNLPVPCRALPALAALALATSAASLSAQTAPAPSPTPAEASAAAAAKKKSGATLTPAEVAAAKNEEVYQLSAFEIKESSDDKWAADSTLLGNRTNQSLVTVSATVDVMTKEFLADMGLFNMDDASAFISGVTNSPRLESRNDNGRQSFRGLSGSGNTSRNFFQWSVPSDTYNVERFDFGKGSNSLMFGDSTPGGQIMTTTKRARFTNFNEAVGVYDSLGSYRMQFDANRKLTKQFALRFNAVNRRDQSYVKGSYQRFRALDLALTYRPFPNTVISIEGERGLYQRRRADNSGAVLPTAAAGRGFSTNNKWYYTSDGAIIQRPSPTTVLPTIDTTGPSGSAVSLLEGQTAGVRLPNGTQKIFNGFGRDFNMLGFGDYLDRPFNVVTAVVEQNIGKLSLQGSYNQQFQHQDRNDNSFGSGNSSPPLFNVDGSGRPYTDMSGNLTAYKIFGNVYKAGRLSAYYPFEFGKWMKQGLVLTGTRTKDYAFNRRFGLANTAAPGSAVNNAITFRAYLDDPEILSGNGWNRFLLASLPVTPTFKPEMVESYVNTGPFVDIRYTSNYTAVLSGEYFGGKLLSMFGVSYNRISRKIPIEAAYATDARGFVTFFKKPEEAPEYYTYDPNFTLSAKSISSGLNYALLRRENLNVNVYVNYLQSFNWQSQLTFTGNNLGPIKGTTREIGFKGDFFHGKIGYTLAAYQIERESAAFAWSPDSLTAVQLEDLFNPAGLLPSDPKFFHVETGLNNERRTVNSQEKSRGVELTLIGQRVYGIQSRVTFSKGKVEAARDFTTFQALLDAAIARNESAALIQSAKDIVDANTSIVVVTGRRSAPYTGSFSLDYQSERFRAVRLGLNGVWTPNYNLAILSKQIYRGGAGFPLSAYAMYDTKVFRQRTNFRLGFGRFYDLIQGNSKFYKTGANSINAATGKPNYIYRYTDPMVVDLRATVRF